MQIIYKTFDGACFTDKEEAELHEQQILHNSVVMFDGSGERVERTDHAVAILLRRSESADALHDLADGQDDVIYGIDSGESGFFFYDEWHSVYNWIDDDVVRALAAAYAYAINNPLED